MKRIIYSHYRRNEIKTFLQSSGKKHLDILFIGATGVGKSSTLNSIITATVSRVGKGVDPETTDIKPYKLNKEIILWDTPGLGDSPRADRKYENQIFKLLHVKKTNADGSSSPLIDLVVLIMDGSSREMGTTFTLLTGKLKKMLRKERLMVIVNQADCAMHSHEKFFTNTKHNTTPELIAFLEEKVISIKNRIAESTGFSIAKPLYYSAKYKYNIKTIFDSILDTILSRIHRNKTL